MKQIGAKVYYEIATGNVLIITSECQGSVIETTKEQDMEIYSELKGKDENEVDFIELEFGILGSIFNNTKSYCVDIKNKKLKVDYYSNEQLQDIKDKYQESQSLNNRVYDISDYLYQQSKDTISDFENYILQTELNKTMEGMN